MSTQVMPALVGLMFPVTRTPTWDTDVQKSVSGKENRLSYMTWPSYTWSGDVSVLRASSPADFQALLGFFNARQGQTDTFLYQDPDDNAVTGQAVGVGDGATTAFQMIKAYGGFVEPALAPNVGGTVNVYLNGALQSTGYTLTGWGGATPGVLTFAAAPAAGVAVTADFGYYYPCRFQADKFAFSLDFQHVYSVKKLTWQSVKN